MMTHVSKIMGGWFGFLCGCLLAADAPKATFSDVPYGPHEAQKLDFLSSEVGPTDAGGFFHSWRRVVERGQGDV